MNARHPFLLGIAALVLPASAWANVVEVSLPLSRMELPIIEGKFSFGGGIGWGEEESLSFDEPDRPSFSPNLSNHIRSEVRLGDRFSWGIDLPAWDFAALHAKVPLAGVGAVTRTWSAAATARYGMGHSSEDGDESDWLADGLACSGLPFGGAYNGVLYNKWSKRYRAKLTDVALVIGRDLSARTMIFGGPFHSRIGHSASFHETAVYCRGEQPVRDVAIERTATITGVNLGVAKLAAGSVRHRGMLELVFAQLEDGDVRESVVRLTLGGYFFGGAGTGLQAVPEAQP